MPSVFLDSANIYDYDIATHSVAPLAYPVYLNQIEQGARTMKCFARWERDDESGVFFRDQTILQFGDSWDFLASFVLLNPGSAVPMNKIDQTGYLRSKALPFFIEPAGGETYVEFSIDPLMKDVLKLFVGEYSGGTIKLYNLFNLKNQHSSEAAEQFSANQAHTRMFAKDQEIKFCHAPVSGRTEEA